MKRITRNPLPFVYLAMFLFSAHIALTAYINSTYLSNFITSKFVGVLYSLGALLTLVGLSFIPKITRQFGNFKTTLGLFGISGLCLLLVGFGFSPLVTVVAFILYLTTNNLIYFATDIFVEHFAKKRSLGHSRGFYLMLVALAWVGGPIAAGAIATALGYSALYGIAFTFLLFGGFVISRTCESYKDSRYTRLSIWQSLTLVHTHKDIEYTVGANFLLQFFYAWMVIYAPLFLHEVVGFDWANIGLIFTIMLVPFVLLEYPLGILADRYFGEKEMLSIGFGVAGTATIIFGILPTTTPLIVWGFVLFLTRVGAAMIESMSEVYFFKKITDKDTGLISIFRDTAPIAYSVAPLIASVLLIGLPYQSLFIILGIVVWSGVFFASQIHDTK